MLPQPELQQKLEAYIRRYYLNELLRGGLFALGLGISAFLLFTFSEYLGRFERPLRAAMFFTLLFGNLALLGYYVLRPLLALYRLRGRMSHAQAALNIGAHFEGVGDRLINALQLQEMQKSGNGSSELLLASFNNEPSNWVPLLLTGPWILALAAGGFLGCCCPPCCLVPYGLFGLRP